MVNITIAIPTYNRLDMLKDVLSSLESVVKANKKIRVLIQDNDSEDGTYKYVEAKYSNLEAFDVCRNSNNLGFAGNFVKCFENIDTEYVIFLSDEDVIVESYLVKLIYFLSQIKPTFVSTNIDFNGKTMRNRYLNRKINGHGLRAELPYVSGLVYDVKESKKILSKLNGKFDFSADYYPNVLLGVALSIIGEGWFFNKKVCRQRYINPCSTRGFQLLDSRWEQFKQFELFLDVIKDEYQISINQNVLNNITKSNRLMLSSIVYMAVTHESEELSKWYLISSLLLVFKEVIKAPVKWLHTK